MSNAPTVVVGRIKHETNTFSPLSTDYEDFSANSLYFGEEILEEFRDTNTDLGGFLNVADARGWQVVPSVAANATPGGPVTAEAFASLRDVLIETLEEVQPDGVLLGLHGAMVSEPASDGDGAILKSVRDVVGDTPVMATLDLHANVSRRMVGYADGLFGYDTYPHVDIGDTGREAARVMARTIHGEFDPVVVMSRANMLIPLPALRTAEEPMQTLLERASANESADIPDVSVFGGFPYADVPEATVSTVSVADASSIARTREICVDITTEAQTRHTEFEREYMAIEQAVTEAQAHDVSKKPLLLADISDNPGGGSAADGTVLLETLIEADISDVGVAIIFDPQAVEAATNAGVGETVEVDLGGHIEANGDPLNVTADVRHLSDGTFRNQGPMSTGLKVQFGQTAVLRIEDIDVIVTSHRQQPYDPQIFRSQNLTLDTYRALVVKSTVHYRAGFEPLVHQCHEVATPGLCHPDLSRLEYDNIVRPVYPFDENW